MAKARRKKKAAPPFVSFLVAREYLGKDGLWNPRSKGSPLRGGFQVNVMGTREHYLRFADFLRRFAERDTSDDGDYHEHFEDLRSADCKVRLHMILRKDDVGDGTWRIWFPKAK